MSLNMLLTEEINLNRASARRLRVIYLPVKYDENRKSPVSVSNYAAEYPKNGGDTRNPDCKHMCFCGARGAQRFFR
jgi:hypothetical protein